MASQSFCLVSLLISEYFNGLCVFRFGLMCCWRDWIDKLKWSQMPSMYIIHCISSRKQNESSWDERSKRMPSRIEKASFVNVRTHFLETNAPGWLFFTFFLKFYYSHIFEHDVYCVMWNDPWKWWDWSKYIYQLFNDSNPIGYIWSMNSLSVHALSWKIILDSYQLDT